MTFLRKHHTYHGCEFFIRIICQTLTLYPDVSTQRFKKSRKRFQQSRFTGSIGTQQAGQLTTTNGCIDFFGYHFNMLLSFIACRQVPYDNRFLFHYSFISLRRFLNSTETTTGAPTNAVTELTGNAPSNPGIRAIKLQSKAKAAPANKEAGIRTL